MSLCDILLSTVIFAYQQLVLQILLPLGITVWNVLFITYYNLPGYLDSTMVHFYVQKASVLASSTTFADTLVRYYYIF